MIFKTIENNIKHILSSKPKILLGFSGGPDSVFLFYFLKKLHEDNKIELICTHLDHGWRKESFEDVKYCSNLCKKYKIALITGHAKDLCLNLKFNGSQEEIGRKLRRHFFEQTLKEQNANFIALAHHLQDQQETFFWRIIRGTTLSGLTCMKQINSPYIRPILNISKQEILEYLTTNKIDYLQDSTNLSDKYLRNRIRKNVLPAMQKCDERFNQKFESTLKHLQEEDDFLQKLTQQAFETVFTEKKGNLKDFLELDLVLQKRLIIFWLTQENVQFTPSENYLNEILRFLKNPRGGSHKLSTSWKLFKKKNLFGIEKNY